MPVGLGSSLSHWNELSYPVGDPNELMTPQAASGHAQHAPGPLTLALLDDIGWEINYDTANTALTDPIIKFNVFPVPATDFIQISNLALSGSIIEIINNYGEVIKSINYASFIPISELQNGIYFLRVNDRDHKIGYSSAFIKM